MIGSTNDAERGEGNDCRNHQTDDHNWGYTPPVKSAKYDIQGKQYPIEGYVKVNDDVLIPLVDIKMKTDLDWRKACLESRLKNPQSYVDMGENVNAVISQLKQTIEKMEAQGIV